MWYEDQWDNSPSKSWFVKVNQYRSKYGLQHGALAHNKQQAFSNWFLCFRWLYDIGFAVQCWKEKGDL